jgi:hypothetical protein
MTARAQRRPAEALDLARQAIEHAATPLQRAQVLSWAELPALVGLGPQHRSDALRVIAEAQDQMSADPDGAQPGRFGFDNAELELHIAEASLVLGDHALARAHAQQSQAARARDAPPGPPRPSSSPARRQHGDAIPTLPPSPTPYWTRSPPPPCGRPAAPGCGHSTGTWPPQRQLIPDHVTSPSGCGHCHPWCPSGGSAMSRTGRIDLWGPRHLCGRHLLGLVDTRRVHRLGL